jgi:uridine kinase
MIQPEVCAARKGAAGRYLMVVETHIQRIVKRNGDLVAFDQKRIATAIYKAAASIGGKDKELAEKLSDLVVERLNRSLPRGATPTVEEIQDLVERVLIECGHAQTAKAYIVYRHRRDMVRKGEIGLQKGGSVETIPWKLLWRTLAWNADHNCDSIEGLNEWVRSGRLPELMVEADAQYEKQLVVAAEEALQKGDVRVIIIAGPSSSGKTTTTYKLAQNLRKAGKELIAVNVDNYFRDLELHPKDEYGDYDYETPEALDLPLFNDHLDRLVRGEEVVMPRYDFHTGKQILDQIPLKVEAHQIILLDTLHGLFDGLTRSVPEAQKFKVYIETFCQVRPRNGRFVRWTDIRLLRRMVRDSNFRNHKPALTLGHWHYVRRSELKHIIPYLHNADLTVNGSLAYELPVLRKQVDPYFAGLVEEYDRQPERQDAIIRAHRVYDLLRHVEPISAEDEARIAGESLIREFIGGSTIKY